MSSQTNEPDDSAGMEEEERDPLADSDDNTSHSSNGDDVDNIYDTFYGLSDESYNDSDSSSNSHEDAPPQKKRNKVSVSLKMSNRSYNWKRIAVTPEAYRKIKSQKRSPSDDSFLTSTDPLNIFNKYFTDSFVGLTVKLTNMRAAKCSIELNITENELKAFIGMLIIMGFHRLPGKLYYWKTNANFGVPRISSVMNSKRFQTIFRFLSFIDSSQPTKKIQNKCDEFSSIRMLLDHLNEKFVDNMELSEWLNINQSRVRPRTSSYETEFFVTALCCAKSGYLFKLNIQNRQECFGGSISDDIARDLLSVVKREGTTVVLGRDYTNFPLVEELYMRNIFVCGELRRKCDPNIPRRFREGIVKPGDFVQSGDFSITVWKDTHVKDALILSTMHNPLDKKSTLKRKVNELTDCPAAVVDYYDNDFDGVKLFDILRLRYNTYWKSRKWQIRFFHYILDATIVNSYLVYRKSLEKIKCEDSEDPLSLVQFRSNLADGLIAGFVGRKRPTPQVTRGKSKKKNSSRTTSIENSVRLTDVGSHMPIKSTSRRCAFCSTKGAIKRSSIMCSACLVGLCLPCFAPFHETYSEN